MVAVAAALVVALGGGALLLRTGWAEQRLAREVVERAGAALQGRLALGAVRVRGAIGICAEQVELRDPEGHPVLRADEICATLEVAALARKQARLRALVLRRPELEVARVEGPGGVHTTTLQRALAARTQAPAAAPQGPSAWSVWLERLELTDGALRLLPAPGAAPALALAGLQLRDGSARWSAGGSAARLQVTGRIAAPGRGLDASLSLDAQLEGGPGQASLRLRALRAGLGRSGFAASGELELATLRGRLLLRELHAAPEDAAGLLAPEAAPLAGVIDGEGELECDGREARLALRLAAGGGEISLAGTAALAGGARWTARLSAAQVDPAGLLAGAPPGRVSLVLDAEGRGLPSLRAGVPTGEAQGTVHLGPASLDGAGALAADLDLRLLGAYLIVKRLRAEALGVRANGRGAAGLDELSLDLEVTAPDLAAFDRALAALQRRPARRLRGSAALRARVTGSPRRPDAELSLRAPLLSTGAGLRVEELAVEGALRGPLARPEGWLTLRSRRVAVGEIGLGAPLVRAEVAWPRLRLWVDAAVRAVAFAEGDEDGDGTGHLALEAEARARREGDADELLLDTLRASWPAGELHLAHRSRLRLRPDETVLEPLRLEGAHGAVTLAARVRPSAGAAPASVRASLALERLDLGHLPAFLLPRGLAAGGRIDGRASLRGSSAAPEVDAELELHGVRAQALHGLDGKLHAQLGNGRLRGGASLRGPGGIGLSLRVSLPAADGAAGSSPTEVDAVLGPVDLAQLAAALPLPAAQAAAARGELELKLAVRGTLGAPRAQLSFQAQELGWGRLHGAALEAALAAEKGEVRLTGAVHLGGEPALRLSAHEPLDLGAVLRRPALLRHLFESPGALELQVPTLPLEALARAGLLAEGSSGAIEGRLSLGGTRAAPRLSLAAKGSGITAGGLRQGGFSLSAEAAERLRIDLEVALPGVGAGSAQVRAAASAEELFALGRSGFARPRLDPLLGRALSIDLALRELAVAPAAALAGWPAKVSGTLQGRVSAAGTADAPLLDGRLALRGVAVGVHPLGDAELSLEGDAAGALLHLGLDPPRGPAGLPAGRGGGGTLLLHGSLRAPLSARTLLDSGGASLREGLLDGRLTARALDVGFASGLFPGLRRTAGSLDADVELQGLLGSPVSRGQARFRGGLFDVVGQGVFEQVAFDASFAPQEIVLDRLTGESGGGHFSAVLVVTPRPSGDGAGGVAFSGELHAGDAEAVRDRTGRDGKPLQARPLPLRQAGEERADLVAEVDFFGDFADRTLTASVKVPEAALHVRALPEKKLQPLAPNPEVLDLRSGARPIPAGVDPAEAAAEERRRREANLRADLRLDLASLRVWADDFDFTVDSRLHASWDAQEPDEPSADGTVEVPHGSFTALGRRFEIESARITETGGELTDPELEIQARYVNPQATVLVLVTGTAKDPQIDLSSDPPMDKDAIAFFLATGRLQGKATMQGGGVDLSNAASSVVGGMLFGELRKQMADVLPVDVLTIETGGGGRPAQASLGKYLGDHLFVGYRQRLAPSPSENSSEGRVEYELGRGVGAEATVGDKSSAAQVTVSRDF